MEKQAMMSAIERKAYNDAARHMQEHGVDLSHDEAEDLGEEAIAWLRSRLGLSMTTDSDGVHFRPRAAYYLAMFRTIIPRHEGGNGKALGDWFHDGWYPTVEEARAALSDARARGWRTRIVERQDGVRQPRVVEETAGYDVQS